MDNSRLRHAPALIALLMVTAAFGARAAQAADRLERFTCRADGVETVVEGRALVEAADGGVLVESRDGALLAIKPNELVARADSGEPFTRWTVEELRPLLLAELGDGFEIVETRRYVIATNAGRPYAEWCGRLFERLHTAFLGYWKRAGMKLEEVDAPLIAVVFAEPEQFAAYATADAGPQVAQTKGYYSIRTNRIILTDLTRVPGAPAARNQSELDRRLDAAILNVATVVHEATHQIAFNCGLHTRYADNPMWLTEGMAMFFEAPDLRSSTGWRTIGKLHDARLGRFQEYARERRPEGSLATLLANEDRFRDAATSTDAYAESWALTYYLIRNHKDAYVDYLARIGAKPRLIWNDGEQRLADFQAAFGEDLEALEQNFLQYTLRLRGKARN
jgi:hypothetical protein